MPAVFFFLTAFTPFYFNMIFKDMCNPKPIKAELQIGTSICWSDPSSSYIIRDKAPYPQFHQSFSITNKAKGLQMSSPHQ